MKSKWLIVIAAGLMSACHYGEDGNDASGSFETDETVISADANGTLKQFTAEEGQSLDSGQCVGYVDSVQLYLKRKQLKAQINAILSQKPDISAQIASLVVQLNNAKKDQERINNMVKGGAASQKQLDDANARVEEIEKQIRAQKSTLDITTQNIAEQTQPLKVEIEEMDDQLSKCRIVNPVNGVVLTKYVMPYEMVTPGKPLYKIANLSSLILRAYITGDQLPQVKLDQQVKVLVDNGPDQYKEYPGTLTWISDKAEFTPKTIMTKDERSDLVYAIKIKVKNDGYLKIGMYGEVKF